MTALASLSHDVATNTVVIEAAAAEKGAATTSSLEVDTLFGEGARFRENGVLLTENYIQLNFKTYSLQEIYGVSLREQPRNQSMAFVLIVFGALTATMLAYTSLTGAAITLVATALIVLALRLAVPNTHVLRLTDARGEYDALMGRDRKYIMRVYDALNAALADSHRS